MKKNQNPHEFSVVLIAGHSLVFGCIFLKSKTGFAEIKLATGKN